ncbi:chloramphenicol resistance protein [Eubacterium sp.]|uniref:chloramphenicol resistance protein n=1 Tax=Eubacterium sp. TaxID=142586 RepID=UPI0026E07CD5|nr:chloramphenicol resistance protein [Eubacterium sp.]MDO5432969.1 chloramphenicol resistance protein [Eubacterium sp.]
MTMLENILKYVKDNCTLLEESHGEIKYNFLSGLVESYGIVGIPGDPVIKKYTDGSALKQYLFHFCSNEFYGSNTQNNVDNDAFYEALEEWFKEQSANRNLPPLEGKKKAQYIETLDHGNIVDNEADEARYAIQCRLVYTEDA